MKIWKLSRSNVEHSMFFTWEKIYADSRDAGEDMFEQYTARLRLYKEDAIIAEYHPATDASLILKDGRRWTWAIDMLEVT